MKKGIGCVFGWFTRKPTITLEDPTFGNIKYKPRLSLWQTGENFPFSPASKDVLIGLEAGPGGPSESHRRNLEELKHQYLGLVPKIAEELYHWHGPHNEWEGLPKPHSSEEMWSIVELDGISIGETSVELLYAFRPEIGWEDAMFTVKIENGKIVDSTFGD